MSNPEKNPQGPGDVPPPPPGPPPYSALGDQQPPPPEKAPQQQNEQQHFPPPPPPQQPYTESARHPNPLGASPVDYYPQPPPHQPPEQRSEQNSGQQSYSIPAYNPAAPVFAPPHNADSKEPAVAQQEHLQYENTSGTNPGPYVESATGAPHDVPAASSAQGLAPDVSQKKPGWGERFTQLGQKAAAPINNLAHKLGSQAFLPQTLDKECDKAAVILKAFCKKGVYADPSSEQPPTSTDPKATETTETGIIDPTKEKPKNRVIVTIPPKVIAKAAGLAIFTTLRAGFHVSGATGSGVLIARLPDGSWSPPSGIQVHSVGGGFSIGLDIYDCVCVINSKEALEAFMNTRVSLGSDLAVVAGPYGAGGAVEFGAAMDTSRGRDDKKKAADGNAPTDPAELATEGQHLKPEGKDAKGKRSLSANRMKPVFSYVKSRGFYAGIQVDGTVVVERKDANAAFYGDKIPVDKILKGEVPAQGPAGMWPTGAHILHDVLRGAEVGALKDGVKEEGIAQPVPSSSAVPSGSQTQGGLPGYVDDGLAKPGVGDYKYQ